MGKQSWKLLGPIFKSSERDMNVAFKILGGRDR